MKTKTIRYSLVIAAILLSCSACDDMLDVNSSSVQYEDKHELNSSADSLYSVVGILSQLQVIADRTVLLGELRGDLVVDNENTEKDLRELINHSVSPTNVFNDYSDYYAVINNCNYYLAKVDTSVIVSNQKVMLKEVAVIKAIRAWTYMQLALNYQSVPFITEPILTLDDAEYWERECEYKDLDAMCDYFIPELLEYLDTDLPSYGNIGGYNSKRFFFPIPLLLGDMCLWKQRYEEAYQFYAYYAYKEKLATYFHGVKPSGINTSTNDIGGIGWSLLSSEYITAICMAPSKLYGTTTNLVNVFSPTDINEGKRSVSPSRLWKELCEKQIYAYRHNTATDVVRYLSCGDLRAIGNYYFEWSDGSFNTSSGDNKESWYLVDVDNEYKINTKYSDESLLADKNSINIYRVGNVFLRMAEALNRAGKPEDAFSILKYGVESVHMSVAGELSLQTPQPNNNFVAGIHSRGSGNSEVNEHYKIDCADFDFDILPDSVVTKMVYEYNDDTLKVDSMIHINTYYGVEGMPNPQFGTGYYDNLLSVVETTINRGTGLGSNRTPDTIRYVYVPTVYLVDKVEQMVLNEMALETAFEGHRFYDLMRIAQRRGTPELLAEKVAMRNGEDEPRDEVLYQKLLNPENWFIQKK